MKIHRYLLLASRFKEIAGIFLTPFRKVHDLAKAESPIFERTHRNKWSVFGMLSNESGYQKMKRFLAKEIPSDSANPVGAGMKERLGWETAFRRFLVPNADARCFKINSNTHLNTILRWD